MRPIRSQLKLNGICALTLAIFLSVPSVFASVAPQKRNCLLGSDVARVRSKFTINVEPKADLCDPSGKTRKIFDALLFIENLQLNNQIPKPWNQGILSPGFADYVVELSPLILDARLAGKRHYDEDCKQAGFAAFVVPSEGRTLEDAKWAKKMFICPSFYADTGSYGFLGMISSLVHESRHHLGFDHVKCTNPNSSLYLRDGACDPSMKFKGAYAAGIEALLQIGFTATDLPPAVRENAVYLAYSMAVNNINESPFDKTNAELVFVRDRSGKQWAFDGQKLIPTNLQNGKIFYVYVEGDLSTVALVSDSTRSKPQFYSNIVVGSDAKFSRVSDDAVKLSFNYSQIFAQTRQQDVHNADLIDFDFTGSTSQGLRYATIIGSQVTVQFVESKGHFPTYSANLEGARPNRVFTSQDIGEAANRVYVMTEENDVFETALVPDPHCPGCQENLSFRKVANPILGYKEVSHLNGRMLLLGLDGAVYEKTSNGTMLVPQLSGQRFIDMSRAVPIFKKND
jgi:hypothetical protein